MNLMSTNNRTYRSSLMIIGLMLEELIKVKDEGMIKADLFSVLGVKTPIGEKYLTQLLNANYAILEKQKWGDLREKHIVKITQKGIGRFEWIIQLSKELRSE
jgi:predicted transcriptional regulator